jgi:hypothetical protein
MIKSFQIQNLKMTTLKPSNYGKSLNHSRLETFLNNQNQNTWKATKIPKYRLKWTPKRKSTLLDSSKRKGAKMFNTDSKLTLIERQAKSSKAITTTARNTVPGESLTKSLITGIIITSREKKLEFKPSSLTMVTNKSQNFTKVKSLMRNTSSSKVGKKRKPFLQMLMK